MTKIGYIKSLNERVPEVAKTFGVRIGNPSEENASRGTMDASQSKQLNTPIDPDIPRVSYGAENTYGRLSNGYKKLNGNWKVLDVIKKYADGNIYTVVMFNADENLYTMIENPFAEDGPERFGYLYNTKVMDDMKVDDEFVDPIVYRSTSYDENMNYRMGFNARVAYQTSVSTIEDGITISHKLHERIRVPEVTTFNAGINDNQIPLFIHKYADENGNETLHTLPKIGHKIDGVTVLATRTKNYNTLIYEFTDDAIKKINPNDTRYKAGKNSIVYDMDIYYNGKEELPDRLDYREIKHYYNEQTAYYEKINEWTNTIKQQGANRTSDAMILSKRAKDFIKVNEIPDWKWKDKEKTFANIVIKFKCYTTTSLHEGFKLVGRYGDKGVISEIRGEGHTEEDVELTDPEFNKNVCAMLGIDYNPELKVNVSHSMMYDEEGREVDIYLNASGALRRENPGQLTEVDLTFISEAIRDKVKVMKEEGQIKEAFDLIMDFITQLNKYEAHVYANFYKISISGKNMDKYKGSKSTMTGVVDSIIENGFYIFKTYDTNLRYDAIYALYDRYPWIERKTMYVDKFGLKKLKVVHPMVVGWKYMLILKQNTNKNFSARSVGRINKIGIPTKSADKKENRTNISDTPINRGETYNLFAALDSTTIMSSDIYTRCSPLASKDLKNILTEPIDPTNIKKWKIKQTYSNVNVLNLQARFKTIGIGYRLITDQTLKDENMEYTKTYFDIFDYKFYDYVYNIKYYKFLVKTFREAARVSTDEEKRHLWDKILNSREFKIVDPPEEIVKAVVDIVTLYEVPEKEPEPEETVEAVAVE